jgi:hypothetical protein
MYGVTVMACLCLVILGVLMALLFGNMMPESFNVVSQIISSQLAYGLLILSFSFKLFSNDAMMREREYSGGVTVRSLYLGKLLGSLFEMIFLPFAFVAGNFSLLSSNAPFAQYWGLYLLLGLAISGLSNFLAVTFTVGALLLLSAYMVIYCVYIAGEKQSAHIKWVIGYLVVFCRPKAKLHEY